MTVESIEKATEDIIKKYERIYDSIGEIKASDVTFDNTIKALIDLEREMITDEGPIFFPQHVVTDKAIRDASVAADKKLSAFEVDLGMKKEVFDNVCSFKDKFGLDGLTHEEQRFVEKTIIAGRRNGLHLDQEKRDRVKAVKKKISELGTQFGANLNEDTTAIDFAATELDGVPTDLVDSFDKADDGKCKVTMKYPHFFPVSRKCKVPETRKKLEIAYQSRCLEENTKILEELIELRQEQAEMLGYESHAHYIQELRMAKGPQNVKKFLSDLAVKLQPLWAVEREELLDLKQQECKEFALDFNGKLDFWDMRYYSNMIEERKYSVDQEKLKEYFPIDKVTEGLLQIYQELLSLKFTLVEGADVWHEDVTMYEVVDVKSSELMGYFYLDMHPRDGKYGHACVMPLQPGCINVQTGERQVNVCAMLANFSKPTEQKPSLLDHGEVETYFHEFGHVMHQLCSKTQLAKFCGTKVERDFVEAPSQMLENWCWEEEPLKKMSGHYLDNSEIPKDILDKLVASRKANAGAFNLRQVILGTFDQRIHTTGKADTTKVFSDTYKEILGVETPAGTNMPANFGHMAGGYDAQYYGYMWSEVYSFDMFEARFKKEGLLNPAVGMDYRNCILRTGGSKDASEMLKDFLGREPNDEAFLRSKGLQAS